VNGAKTVTKCERNSPILATKKHKEFKNRQNPFELFVLFRGSISPRRLNKRRTPLAPVQQSASPVLRQAVSIRLSGRQLPDDLDPKEA
jgi:hypothetical protein